MDNSINAAKPRVAVSACLLGQPVRYDGGHKRDRFVADTLSQCLDFESVCPEMLAGLGTPRPVIQLRNLDGKIRLVQSNDPTVDLTETMMSVAENQSTLLGDRISGFIAQRKSPSCGFERVPVSNGSNRRKDFDGVGLFTRRFMKLCPLIPVEEEGRLNDPILRENFLARVYALHRWRQLPTCDIQGFIEFHSRHKLMLMLRGSNQYSALGRLVAGVTKTTLAERREQYITLFMQTLAKSVSRKHHCNVMQHMLGYFKKALSGEDKQELLSIFHAYKDSQVPLSTPLTLLTHHLRKFPNNYLGQQYYLKPYPETLALRANL